MAYIETTQAEAKALLQTLSATTCDPVLSDEEVERVLAKWRVGDRFGLTPVDTGYTPTWDLNGAAAEAWRIKAGKAASDASFSADGASYARKEVIENCRQMARDYEARIVRGVSNVERPLTNDVIGNL